MSDETDEVGQWRPSSEFPGLLSAAGSWCPACATSGGMFHYGANVHQCENCLEQMTDKQFYDLLMKNPTPRKT